MAVDIGLVVQQLREQRARWRESQQRLRDPGGRELPSREALDRVVRGLRGALFPMRLGPSDLRQASEDYYVGHTLDIALNELLAQVALELRYGARHHRGEGGTEPAAPGDERAAEVVQAFAASLAPIRALLDTDVQAAFHGDPAARSVDEVLLCYPGIEAMIHHRIARIVAEQAHTLTGIDIHPGATIGAGFFIDHGTGVVIGETAVIGERVRLYQAVTLGAKRFPVDGDGHLHKGQARHPIVEDDVVIYAGASILGRVTLGARSTIGGNVWLTRSVPADSNITQATLQHDGAELHAAPP